MFEDPNEKAAPVSKDDWNSVKAEVDGVEPPQTEAVLETLPEVAPVAEVVDPYTGLSAEVVAKLKGFDTLMAEQPKLLQALKETQGRVSAMQSEFAKRQTQSAAAPNETLIAAAAKDPETWSALKKDFPEWGEGIQAFVDARFAALGPSGMTPEQIESVVAQRVGSATEGLAGRLEQMLIETKYPDWLDVCKTPEFGTWFAAQKPEVQALQNSDKGRDALAVLDLFHEAKAKPVAQVKQTRQQVLAAAVQGKSVAPAATKTVSDMTPTELWNHEALLRKARAEA